MSEPASEPTLERELGAIEQEVFDSRVREDYRRIYRLRGRIGQIDRAASGLAEAVGQRTARSRRSPRTSRTATALPPPRAR